MSTYAYTTESIKVDYFIPRDELYLPGVPLTGQQLDALEAAKDEVARRIDRALLSTWLRGTKETTFTEHMPARCDTCSKPTYFPGPVCPECRERAKNTHVPTHTQPASDLRSLSQQR